MKVSCIQMDMRFADPDYNFQHAAELIRETARREQPDVMVLPETWNVGFFPKENLVSLCDTDGSRIQSELGSLAAELKVNLVAGSVANYKNGQVYNTAFVFNRQGECIYTYDKIHLFTPSGEHEYFTSGNQYGKFQLDGVDCGLIICYDVRFPELTRSIALQGIDILFVVSQWPSVRAEHLDVLTHARAIENQMFLALCNSCGTSGATVHGGGSTMYDPWGVRLAQAGTSEEIISAASI